MYIYHPRQNIEQEFFASLNVVESTSVGLFVFEDGDFMSSDVRVLEAFTDDKTLDEKTVYVFVYNAIPYAFMNKDAAETFAAEEEFELNQVILQYTSDLDGNKELIEDAHRSNCLFYSDMDIEITASYICV
jgi:hypothetical protein